MGADRRMFVNLAVEDLERSVAFYSALGFDFDPRFTDASATCMVVGSGISVMLLVRDRFSGFTNKELCDTTVANEALLAVSCESRAEVEDMVATALANGGSAAVGPEDHGFMFGWSFLDPDGHHWEPMWMDPAVVAGDPPG